MIFGLCGAHRCGKSTLAKQIAEDLGLRFVSSSFGEAAKRHGVDAVAPMRLEQRVAIQQTVLMEHVEMCRSTTDIVVTDRTPVDMLAYLLAEFHMQSHIEVNDIIVDAVEVYKQMALKATDTYYDQLFVLQPLLIYTAEPGKPAINKAYQDHVALLVDGACVNLDAGVNLNWINTTDFEERREACSEIITKRLDELDALRKSSPHVH